jgi:hypothetical protein
MCAIMYIVPMPVRLVMELVESGGIVDVPNGQPLKYALHVRAGHPRDSEQITRVNLAWGDVRSPRPARRCRHAQARSQRRPS